MKIYDLEYADLVYFGDDLDSSELEHKFQKELTKRFPEAKFNDAYDNIKGYRQEVYLKEEDVEDNYYAWIIGNGYLNLSLCLQIMSMQEEKKERFKNLIEKAKKEYPKNFKKEA